MRKSGFTGAFLVSAYFFRPLLDFRLARTAPLLAGTMNSVRALEAIDVDDDTDRIEDDDGLLDGGRGSLRNCRRICRTALDDEIASLSPFLIAMQLDEALRSGMNLPTLSTLSASSFSSL